MEPCLWADDGPVQSGVVVRRHMTLLRPEPVKGSDPSGHVSIMPNQSSKSRNTIFGQAPDTDGKLDTLLVL